MFISALAGRLPAAIPLALALLCSAGAFGGLVTLMSGAAGATA